MEIQGTRFGVLEFEENEIIEIADGLLGFPLSKKFLLFPYGQDSSFFWLQSVDEPEIAFIVVNPFDFFADLEFSIQDEDASALGLENSEDVEVFSLVTIPEGRPEEMRTNLAGPVVVNTGNRRGRQILIKELSPRQPLIPKELRAKYLKETDRKKPVNRGTRRRVRQLDKPKSLKVAAAG
ncbi:MAG: flagellar assembly protein FliW [Magnetococcales bacterium]|nr:flagellar assembly protein FliW [Magnetococcales bacterium]